ncbi:MAG: NAD(P)H-binding protein [Actinobacteria bacterium]|nr:NAD(P)H-binding protein [Actinomycetota bacterium]
MKVLIFGASGVIGRPLAHALARTHDVVAVSRREHHEPGDVEWKIADATDRDSVAGVLADVEVVYYLVHSLGNPDFQEEDMRAAGTTAREAERAGVKQLVYLSGLGDDSETLSPHLRSRRETGNRLASTSVPLTTLRAAMVVGRGSAAFETIVALVDRLPAMVAPRWVSTRTQPVALADVVAYLAGVCELEVAYGVAYDVGGPEVMTYRDMMERIARLRGKRPFIVEVPVLTPYLSSLWLHLVTPVNAGVARPLIEGLRTETVVRDDRIRELLPIDLTSFDAAVRSAFEEKA